MKKSVLLLILMMMSFVIIGCAKDDDTTEQESAGLNDPFSPEVYVPTSDLNHESPIPLEYTIDEDFDDETLNQTPRNWYLYTNSEYGVDPEDYELAQEVVARTVLGVDDNQYVEMYSAGVHSQMYPQDAPSPTFIFTTQFNLDQDRAGVAYGALMIPNNRENNPVTLSVATGSVPTIGVIIEKDLSINVKVGGPFFYYSGKADAGDIEPTIYTATTDTWYAFKFEWDAETDFIAAYLLVGETYEELWHGNFHISSRINAEADGTIMVPNVVRVTMPKYQEGWACLDNVKVERRGDAS